MNDYLALKKYNQMDVVQKTKEDVYFEKSKFIKLSNDQQH